MAVQPVQPFIMRNAIIEFDGTDFAAAVESAVITPSGGVNIKKGLKPSAVFTFAIAATHTLDLTYMQDWHIEESLSRFLYDHAGETLPCTVNPDDQAPPDGFGDGSHSWALTVSIAEGAVGGPVDEVAMATASLGVVGRPVPTFTAATP